MSEGRPKERHGMHRSKEYNSWACMKSRCLNPKSPVYRHYGGRGITVCSLWRDSFIAFLADLGPAPGPLYSLERIDNERGYEPGNVRWATPLEQAPNMRSVRLVSVGDRTMTVAAWSRATGIAVQTIYVRVKRGWSWEDAVSTPPDLRYFNRETRARRELCQRA